MASRSEISDRVIDMLLAGKEVTRGLVLQEMPVRPAALFEVVTHLSRQGLVYEPLRKGRNAGRRPSPILISSGFGLFLGVELEIGNTIGVCLDAQGTVVARSVRSAPAVFDAAAAQGQIAEVVADLRRQVASDGRPIRGIGLADPGLVDMRQGRSIKAVNIPGWEDLQTQKWLQEFSGVPAQLVAAPLARAYAEFIAAGSPVNQSLLHVQIDEAIGGGFIKGGRLFLGDSGCAMELGHLVVQENGPMCQCGNRGCLEAVVGLRGLSQRVGELARHGVSTALSREAFTLPWLLRCVEAGDRSACTLAHEVGEAIGTALSSVVCILNPSAIVFSGTMAGLGPRLLESIRHVLSLRCLPDALQKLQLQISKLGDEGTATGAAMLIRQESLRAAARAACESD